MLAHEEYPNGTAFNGCYICRASKRDDEKFVIDTEREIDFEGFLVVCEKCCADFAAMIDYVPAKRSDALQKTLDGLHTDYKAVLSELDDKNRLLDLLRQYTDEPEAVTETKEKANAE
jgi:hypothetical protein